MAKKLVMIGAISVGVIGVGVGTYFAISSGSDKKTPPKNAPGIGGGTLDSENKPIIIALPDVNGTSGASAIAITKVRENHWAVTFEAGTITKSNLEASFESKYNDASKAITSLNTTFSGITEAQYSIAGSYTLAINAKSTIDGQSVYGEVKVVITPSTSAGSGSTSGTSGSGSAVITGGTGSGSTGGSGGTPPATPHGGTPTP